MKEQKIYKMKDKKIVNSLWNILGFVSGSVLLTGLFWKIPVLLPFSVGVGGAWILLTLLDKYKN